MSLNTSKAIILNQHGGPEVLVMADVEVPAPRPGEITLVNHAVGLNFIDIYYRTGLYPHPLPHGLGFEAAGIVERVAADVDYLRPGDRVAYALGPLGAYSRRRTMPAQSVVKLPDAISFEEAAAVMMKGLTAQYLLRQTYPIQPGQTILFHAAAGGVGLIACQWARHLGVRLIGTVSSPEKAKLAMGNGAWQTIDYSRENIPERVLELTDGKNVPVVYDGVGQSTWEASLACLQPRGMMVSFGNASGPVTGVSLSVLQKKSLYVTRPGITSHVDTREKLIAMSSELFDLIERKAIHVPVSRKFALEQAAKAQALLSARETTGSCILIPED